MTRIVSRPIVMVRRTKNGMPSIFRDKETVHHVDRVVDWWKETRAWWKDEGPITVYRVITEHGAYDLECREDKWYIYRIHD